MLITFKAKASPEVTMYKEHAERILGLLNKSPTRGVITAAEAGSALAALEHEVALSKLHPDVDIEHDVHTPERDEDEAAELADKQRVGFGARAYPLLEMLRSAMADGHDIVWGI